jgi:hypothetical protein
MTATEKKTDYSQILVLLMNGWEKSSFFYTPVLIALSGDHQNLQQPEQE